MKITIKNLRNCFEGAKEGNYKYVGIKVQLAEEGRSEIIITENKNFDFNLEYYKKAYNSDLTHKTNKSVKIVEFTMGNSFKDLEKDLCY